jgi:hypothetical protein
LRVCWDLIWPNWLRQFMPEGVRLDLPGLAMSGYPLLLWLPLVRGIGTDSVPEVDWQISQCGMDALVAALWPALPGKRSGEFPHVPGPMAVEQDARMPEQIPPGEISSVVLA